VRNLFLVRLSLLLFLFCLAAMPGWAQHKNEVGLLLGGIVTPDQGIVPSGRLEIGAGYTFQATYARQLTKSEKIALYFEVPFLATPLVDVRSGDPAAPQNYASLFVTPGIRFKFRPDERVSPFSSIGGGYARFDESELRIDGAPNTGARGTNSGVLQLGGGVDYKVFSRISLRGEVRDFYSGKPQYNVTPEGSRQHNVVVSGGFVVHF